MRNSSVQRRQSKSSPRHQAANLAWCQKAIYQTCSLRKSWTSSLWDIVDTGGGGGSDRGSPKLKSYHSRAWLMMRLVFSRSQEVSGRGGTLGKGEMYWFEVRCCCLKLAQGRLLPDAPTARWPPTTVAGWIRTGGWTLDACESHLCHPHHWLSAGTESSRARTPR